jgi:hypothetical protein
MMIIPRKKRLYTSIINNGSIVCGTEGRIKNIEENAANNDNTEKPKTTL